MNRARGVALALVAASLFATTACASNAPTPRAPKPKGDLFSSYVAMGDSNTAGPGIHPMDRSAGACSRSKKNWPTLLAKRLKIPTVDDVSCNGAMTSDITKARSIVSATPGDMIGAVTADTDLVTVSLGGNDEGGIAGIVVSCLVNPFDAGKCTSYVDNKLPKILAKTTKRLPRAIKRIQAKAPKARIVMVGYLNPFPPADGCAMKGLTPEQVAPARAGYQAIDRMFAAVAKGSGLEYVSLSAMSAGHVSCNGDSALVNGLKPALGNGAYLHPNKAGMRAVAKKLADVLTN